MTASLLDTPSYLGRGATPSMIRRAVDRRGLAVFGAATAAALLLGGVMLFAIWARTRVTSAGYELAKASREHQQLLRKREALQLELARLRSPQRLQAVAEKLGMGPATAARTVVLLAPQGARRAGAEQAPKCGACAPITLDPVHTDHVRTDSVRTGPVYTDPVRTGPARELLAVHP
jgi:cell division protein FtsL